MGVKVDLTSDLSLTAAYFDSKADKAGYDGSSAEYIVERGLEVNGMELELKGRVNDKLDLTLGLSNIIDAKNGTKDAREVPETTASMWANVSVNPKLGWAVGVMHQGDSLIKDGGTQMLPAYTRVDAALYYMLSDDFRLQLNMENLTDKLYFPHSHSTHQVSVGRERNVRLSLTRSF